MFLNIVILFPSISAIVAWIGGWSMLAGHLRVRGVRVRYRMAWGHWRILTGYSLPSFLAHSVATPVLWLAMTLVVRAEDGFAGLGIYHAAYQWHGPLVFLPMILMSVSIPVLVREWEEGQNERFRKIFLGLAGVAGVTTFVGAAVLSIMSPWIMSLYGPGFSDGWMVLVVLLMAAPLHAVANISSGGLLGMNRAWSLFFANLGWGGTLLTVTVLLQEPLGVLGLAVAFLTAYLVLASTTITLVLLRSNARVRSVGEGAAAAHSKVEVIE